jgi:hypothetical protein
MEKYKLFYGNIHIDRHENEIQTIQHTLVKELVNVCGKDGKKTSSGLYL